LTWALRLEGATFACGTWCTTGATGFARRKRRCASRTLAGCAVECLARRIVKGIAIGHEAAFAAFGEGRFAARVDITGRGIAAGCKTIVTAGCKTLMTALAKTALIAAWRKRLFKAAAKTTTARAIVERRLAARTIHKLARWTTRVDAWLR